MAKNPLDSGTVVVLVCGQRFAMLAQHFAALEQNGELLFLRTRGDPAEEEPTANVHVLLGGIDAFVRRSEIARAWGQAGFPFLLCLTAEEAEAQEIFSDADDILVLPSSKGEIRKRVLRLAYQAMPQDDHVLRLGPLALDPATYQVTVQGRLVTLAWQEYQLLKFLMHSPGRVFSRQQILAEVWGVQDYGGTRTVDVHIRRLRYKLGTAGEDLFRTVKNVGYGLISPVDARSDVAPPGNRRPHWRSR